MGTHVDLLPPSATALMRALAAAGDPLARLDDAFSGINTARANPPPSFLPFLVWQYGLGKLSPFVPNLYDLIDEGVDWSRLLGTIAAVRQGLGFIGYDGTVVNAPVRRRFWNRFAIELSRVRDADLPDLARIEGIVGLSKPLRSRFKRGFRGYDLRAAETSLNRFSGALLSNDSGVRIDPAGAKWSFGRRHDLSHTLTETELTALGLWIAPGAPSPLWVNDNRLWVTVNQLWADASGQARIDTILTGVAAAPTVVRLKRADGSVIGHVRCVMRPVQVVASGGDYDFGGDRLSIAGPPFSYVLVRARTGFGDGDGSTVATAELLLNFTLSSGVPPGKLWLLPSEVTGGVAVASKSVSVPLGKTVRDLFIYRLGI